jgi:hypothetical protein
MRAIAAIVTAMARRMPDDVSGTGRPASDAARGLERVGASPPYLGSRCLLLLDGYGGRRLRVGSKL